MFVTDVLRALSSARAGRLRKQAEVLPHPGDTARQFVPGPNPDRVLLLGGGPAVGFGVLTHELALPGQLARALAAATGRGASVDVLPLSDATAAGGPRLLDEVRLSLYDAVIVCIGSVEAHELLLRTERWRTDLARLLDALRAATTTSTVIAVLPIRPLAARDEARTTYGAMVGDRAGRLDRVAEEVCGTREGVVHLTQTAQRPEAPRTAAAYYELAEQIAPMLTEWLDYVAVLPPPEGARSLRAQPDPEAERQQALDRTGLVHTGSTARLERLLANARELFDTAGAAITLVDSDRVVFKAAVGMSGDDVPRTAAPCHRTIRQSGAFVLTDLDDEPIARDGWRFYAGHPLESPDGYRIGALCLLDTAVRPSQAVDRVALAEVAARIEAELWSEVARSHGPATERHLLRSPGDLTSASGAR